MKLLSLFGSSFLVFGVCGRHWVLQQLKAYKLRPEDLHNLTLVQIEPDGSLTIDKSDWRKL